MFKHLLSNALIALALIAAIALLTESPPAKSADAQTLDIVITADVTSYSSEPAETDDTPEITASGSHVHDGTLACPTRYAFGTKAMIEGKEYVCEDRMNRKYPDRFDVWSPTKEAATAWGLQTIEVTIEQ